MTPQGTPTSRASAVDASASSTVAGTRRSRPTSAGMLWSTRPIRNRATPRSLGRISALYRRMHRIPVVNGDAAHGVRRPPRSLVDAVELVLHVGEQQERPLVGELAQLAVLLRALLRVDDPSGF